MRLYLDTEFNGLGGELLSMALVSDDGREWYQICEPHDSFDPWVAMHVAPHFETVKTNSTSTIRGRGDLAASLEAFLADFRDAEIIADWPADFEHFASLLTIIGANGGFKEAFPCTMRMINTPELKPAVPHNALSDARALRDWCSWGLAGAA